MTMRGVALLLSLALLSGTARADSFASWAAKAERSRKNNDDAAAAIGAYTSSLLLWKKSDGWKAKVKVLSGRAELYEKGGEAPKALKDLSAALALDPKNPSLHHRRGRVHLELSNLSSAISDFYKAVALDLNFKDAYFDRARAYELQGDIPFAKEDYKTACRLGLKKACALAKTAGKKRKESPKPLVSSVELVTKTTAAPQAPAVERQAPAVETAPEPSPPAAPAQPPPEQAIFAPPAAAPTPARPDFSLCRRALDACAQRGESFGSCVQKAKVCENAPESPAKGCCPRACVKRFAALVDADESEAAAFREVFSPKSSCGESP